MKMGWAALVGGLSIGGIALSMLPPCTTVLMAQAGCCKVRSALNATWIVRPDLTLGACRDLNAQRDRDDPFEEKGFVWWDRSCR